MRVNKFSSESMIDVIHGIIGRLEGVFKEFGYVQNDGEANEPELAEAVPLPFRPRAPKAYRRRGGDKSNVLFQQTDPAMVSIQGWCNLHYRWFSLHAGVAIKADDRSGLKKLIRYTSRSPVYPSNLAYVDPESPETSFVRLTLKKAWRDGTTSLEFSQTAFTEKMAELIPPTWFNLTRYFGVFAPNHFLRDFIVPEPKKKKLSLIHI